MYSLFALLGQQVWGMGVNNDDIGLAWWAPLYSLLMRPFSGSRTVLPSGLLRTIQRGTMNYSYRGSSMLKNPFDLAIYLLLLDQLMPRTIIEIGSAYGGSGRFFADQTRIRDLDTMVYSFDINPVTNSDRDNLRFLKADIHDLQASELPRLLATAPRPWLVVEDGPHTFEGSLAALQFFDEFLRPGDYIVVEDGNLLDLGHFELRNGPVRAIRKFLQDRSENYVIDRELCDLYGRNATWNKDGYLKRI